jgi:hypothetical protein
MASGNKIHQPTDPYAGTAYGASYTTGDVIGIALDMTNGKLWFAKNGTWQASGNPAAGTNACFTGITGTLRAALGAYSSTPTLTANFGASAFAYSPPSGFNAGLH